MKTEQVETKLKKKFRIKPGAIIIVLLVIAAIAGAGYYFTKSKKTAEAVDIGAQRTATASTGDIVTSVTGSGPISSANEASVSLKTGGTVTKVYVKAGQRVKAGDPICDLDTQDIVANIQNAQDNLTQTQLTQDQNLESLKELNVKAPFSGQVTNIAVNEGDIIGKNGVVVTIVDSKNMKLTVPFSSDDIKSIKVGDIADINLQSLMQSIEGKVTYVGNSPYASQTGGELYNVEITVKNPGSLIEGMKANADINTKDGVVSSADTGTLDDANKYMVKSNTGGTVNKILVRQYQSVNAGQIIAELQNDDLNNSITSTQYKLDSLKEQLNSAKEQLAYYKVTSPISGVVSQISIKVGDSLKGSDIVSTILDDSHYQFQVDVDELDIAKVKVGQKVNVTVDALTQTSVRPLSGVVSDIAVEGTSSNGVTTYPVTITIENSQNRSNFSGMGNFSGNSAGGAGNWGGMNGNSGSGTRNGSGANGSSGNGGNWRSFFGGNNSGTNGTSNNAVGNFGSQNRANRAGNTASLYSSLRAGMNANAEILINSTTGVLTVPIESIFRSGSKDYVMVKSDAQTVQKLKDSGKYINVLTNRNRRSNSMSGNISTTGSQTSGGNNGNQSSSQNSSGRQSRNSSSTQSTYLKQLEKYYADAIPTEVQVGANDETNIQIVSGLKEGQVIVLPPVVTSQTNSSSGSQGGMFGGFGGGFGGATRSLSGNNNRNYGGNGNGNNSSNSGNSGNSSNDKGGN